MPLCFRIFIYCEIWNIQFYTEMDFLFYKTEKEWTQCIPFNKIQVSLVLPGKVWRKDFYRIFFCWNLENIVNISKAFELSKMTTEYAFYLFFSPILASYNAYLNVLVGNCFNYQSILHILRSAVVLLKTGN